VRLKKVVIGSLQKANDFIDYWLNRGRMLRRFHRDRAALRRSAWSRTATILIVRLGSIGDVVRATAVVAALKREYPGASIDFLTSPAARPLVEGHPDLRVVYDVASLGLVDSYDWVINLQNPEPLEAFLVPGVTYRDVLDHLSTRTGAKLISGRHVRANTVVTSTNVVYCRSEMEELFLIALLPFDHSVYPESSVPADDATDRAVRAKCGLPAGPLLGLYLGSNSIGCGADNGFRTYSIEYVERLIDHFTKHFTVVVIGQSKVRTPEELNRYRGIVRANPRVIDLVDKTSLAELASVVGGLDVLVSTDSSPIHLARARGVPVVGLFVFDAAFRIGPRLEYENLIGLNSASPCFYYTWRWKYFCGPCRDPKTRAAYCHHDVYAFGVDRIPVERVDRAVQKLLRARPV
jgi:ADP-heptose:LPS heptosyltransferase